MGCVGIQHDWIGFLQTERLYGPDDPLFPSTEVGLTDAGVFGALGLSRTFWKNAGPIRKAFRHAFEGTDLPYFNPHSFRKTLAQIGERTRRTPEEFKAWSQNLGHENVLTTFTSYGEVRSDRQAEILQDLGKTRSPSLAIEGAPDDATIQRVLKHLYERAD